MIDDGETGSMRDPVAIAAFSKFYKEHFPSLVALVRYLGGSYNEAIDCVQDAMAKALPPVWITLDNPHAWCRRVCTNNFLRTRGRSREDVVADMEEAVHPIISPSAAIEEFEQHFEVVRLLRSLSLRRRQVMALFLDGAPYAEIAEILEISEATVRSTHRSARAQLARVIDNDGRAPQ